MSMAQAGRRDRSRDARRIALHALPLLVFGLSYFATWNIESAMIALVAGSTLSLLLGVALERQLLLLPLAFGAIGSATTLLGVYFHNPDILKLKATIFHAVAGTALLGLVAVRRNPFKAFFGEPLFTEAGWRRLMILFGLLSLATALANPAIWRTQSEATWVFFHFPGSQIMHLVALATQLSWMKRDHAEALRAAKP